MSMTAATIHSPPLPSVCRLEFSEVKQEASFSPLLKTQQIIPYGIFIGRQLRHWAEDNK